MICKRLIKGVLIPPQSTSDCRSEFDDSIEGLERSALWNYPETESEGVI